MENGHFLLLFRLRPLLPAPSVYFFRFLLATAKYRISAKKQEEEEEDFTRLERRR